MLCACSSPSDLSLCSASQSLSISKSQSSNSAQILKSTEISWNIFGSSGPSSEVPDLFQKFRTSPGVSDFEFFHEIFSYPFIFISSKTTPFIIQNPLSVSLSLSKPSPSPSQAPLSLSTLLLLKSPKVLQISESLDRSACKLIISVSIAFP